MKTVTTTSPKSTTTTSTTNMSKPTILSDWGLRRRDLLKGLGVGLGCLPILRPEMARAAGAAKLRLITVLTSEGYRQADWAPKVGPLAGQTLPFSTSALQPIQDDVIVMPDLGNPNFVGPGGGGGHGSYGSIFWGLDPGHVSYKQPTGKTLDQVIANALPRPASGRVSLPLQVQLSRSPQSSPEPGSSHCFWLGKGEPINPIADPYATYMEIFGGAMATPGAAPDPAVMKLMATRKSVLDYVGRNLDAFKARLGSDDRMSIDAHHNSVRDLEQQLQGGGGASAACGGAPGTMIDLTDGMQYPNIMTAHMHLMVAALKCGVTNVATLQLSDSSGNNINFAFVPGIPAKGTGYKTAFRNYHDLGHNPILNGTDHKRIVDQWMMAQLATLAMEMKGVQEDGGTLLDNSVILWGNHMQDGSNHDAGSIPWVMAGKGGGYFATGQCVASKGKPLNGVMTDICQAFNVPSPFGATWPGLHKV